MTFVDTNVLVQSTATAAPFHMAARSALARLRAGGPVAISRQILREYFAASTRPQSWAKALTLAEATEDTDGFIQRFAVLEDGPAVWSQLMALSRRFTFGGKQVHDANIVATMLAHRETRLLTFNGADFRRFGSLIEVVAP
ncbi:MAG: PIN domain-containing protein [Gemmatimonadaceae bacterium]|nr:PIN domain-containing protein [Acetobacteraceae bacterium]